MGVSLDEGSADDETKILKRIEWLNDYGGIAQDIDYNEVAASLDAVGIDHAMTILKELEDQRKSVQDPTAFIKNGVASSRRSAKVGPGNVDKAESRRTAVGGAVAAGGGPDVRMLAGFVGLLNKSNRLKKPVNFSEVAGALDSLGPKKAAQVLQQMQEKGLGLDDPVQYIRATAEQAKLVRGQVDVTEYEDDVQKITKRLNWLNQFGGLSKKIKVNEVVGALYCLGIPQAMAILKGLQQKGAVVPDPTAYIKSGVQRANKAHVGVAAQPAVKEEAAAAGAFDEEVDEDQAYEEAQEMELGLESLIAVGAEADEEEEEEDEELGGGEVDEAALGEEMGDEFAVAEPDEDADVEEVAPGNPTVPKKPAEKRVVGAVKGLSHLVPGRHVSYNPPSLTEPVPETGAASSSDVAPAAAPPKPARTLPVTPEEKMLQVHKLATKCGLTLDQPALKSLARVPFYRAKDLIDEVLLGGRNRQGVHNPSKYLTISVQKMSCGLGVEQGIAMELAVSVGVVLNNEALDELASIPRKESHSIIREVARKPDAREDPITFIRGEVAKCRAQLDARPWPPRA
eukprot:NODE_3320_length_2053_cov_14.367601.p1 GENE.NODE_3320_length_2053_cov_14.367601~~NODE_3320_length_2053_cov_14.367601.p1  ORF type:complete len:615 (+),score=245.66 NODE_3320_length_2053_cov_14.367601:140-1846(+)